VVTTPTVRPRRFGGLVAAANAVITWTTVEAAPKSAQLARKVHAEVVQEWLGVIDIGHRRATDEGKKQGDEIRPEHTQPVRPDDWVAP
jgi:hypothetical protein